MVKDLIIGGASNYTWDQLKYWINSIKKSGYTGDVVLVGTNYTKETIDKLTQEGVILSLYGKQDSEGNITSNTTAAPHVERFFHLWNFLNTTDERYRFVISTDTRDVIFQTNPSEWLEENCVGASLVASSEGIRYKNEPWNNQNILETFGPYFHNIFKEKIVCNVGVIAGDFDYVKGLLSFIFHLSVNRPIPIVDQAVYNFIINTPPFDELMLLTNNLDGWAIQLGTTIGAVEAGKGDLGMMYKNNIDKYKELYEDNQPTIEDGVVYSERHEKFCIVHMYDRVPELKDIMEKKYES